MKKINLAATALLFAFSFSLAQKSYALTPSEVISAIDKAKVLDASIRVNAQVTPDLVYVSTYKNPKANDHDCKIEAVLLAKTVMDLDSKVPRVEVRFFHQNALSRYKKISISAGDVKAFASGSMSEDQLLASLALTEEETKDPNARATSYLQENQYVRKKKEVSSRIDKDIIIISAGLDPTLDDDFLKLEALRLAQKGFEAVPDVKIAEITFYDASADLTNRTIRLNRDEQKTLSEGLASLLKDKELKSEQATKLSPEAFDVTSYKAKDGKLKAEREALLNRLKGLKEAGVGYSKDINRDLVDIENALDSLDDTQLRDKINKLSDFIGKYEENLKRAKEFKAAGGKDQAAKAGKTDSGSAGTASSGAASAPAAIDNAGVILKDPEGYVNYLKGKLKGGENHPNFYNKILPSIVDTLKKAGRGQEALKFEQQMNDLKARNAGQ